MKVMALLLVLITLYLSVIPCCGEDDNCIAEGAIMIGHEHSDDHEGEGDMPDADLLCSPFYACGNCLGLTFSSIHSFHFSPGSFSEQNFNGIYRGFLPGSYHSPLLKPPIQI
ncbi:hypothetical protein AAG747_12920 [Rapidithrix thailandica]|uniref:Uncharacterized protein n=1 Tax=Rapidithrix thailandica TaxID=413964 RepID=A0AAW9SD79_9BACT